MSIHGIEVTVTVTAGQITDDEAERVYTSLESNFALKSIDMFINAERTEFSFLFGVESPDLGTDTEEFAQGVITDALTKALGGTGEESSAVEFSNALVGSFA